MFAKLTLVGNLGQNPEMRYLPDGKAVTNLNIACNRRWKDAASGQQQEEVSWFRVSVWGPQAEAANQYLAKGRQVLIEGRLRPDPNTGGPRIYARHNGSAGAAYEVVADRVQFLGGASEAAGAPVPVPAPNGTGHNGQVAVEQQPTAYEHDEIPF